MWIPFSKEEEKGKKKEKKIYRKGMIKCPLKDLKKAPERTAKTWHRYNQKKEWGRRKWYSDYNQYNSLSVAKS